MISTNSLIAKFRLALDEKWGYIWGQSGGVWTQAKQNAATREMTVKYGSRWIGRRVADCSGLFSWAFKELGGYMYHGSNTIWNKYCTARGTLAAGQTIRPGTAVFLVKNGNRHHIGLFIGNDTVVEAKGTRSGVVSSALSHWDEWGELTGVDYMGEGEPVVLLLRKGSQGMAVRETQEALMALGYALPRYGADGKFGEETLQAVKRFQTDHSLAADGICGGETQSALASALDQLDAEDETGSAVPPEEEADGTDGGQTASRVLIVCDSGNVNIRTGNGAQYSRISSVAPGSTFAYVATAENGWNAIVVGAKVGWVSGEFSKVIG